MVNFSDLNGDKNGRGKNDLPKTDETVPKKSRLSFSRLDKEKDQIVSERASEAADQSRENRNAVYEQAVVYLRKVFDSVRNRRQFPLDPGIDIVRQIIEVQTIKDPLFIKAIHSDDPYGFLINNCVNVAIFAVKLADSLGYDKRQLVEIGLAGLLHEVGMGIIPEELIYKKEKLTRKEFEIFRKRTEYSYKILSAYGENYAYLAETAIQLQERIDGSGYPLGLRGEEISDYAQIIGLVDMYEALIHSRPQRERFLHFSAVKEIIKTGKKCFQKKYIKALLEIFSIFPLGSYVKLNSNAIGKVIDTYPDASLRPKIQVVLDSQGNEVLVERVVDLRENPILYIVDSISQEDLKKLSMRKPDGKTFKSPDDTAEGVFSRDELIRSTAKPSGSYALKGLPDLDETDRIPFEDNREAGGRKTGGREAVDEHRRVYRRRSSKSRKLKYVLIVGAIVMLTVAILWQLGFVSSMPQKVVEATKDQPVRGVKIKNISRAPLTVERKDANESLSKNRTETATKPIEFKTSVRTTGDVHTDKSAMNRDFQPGVSSASAPKETPVDAEVPEKKEVIKVEQQARVSTSAPAEEPQETAVAVTPPMAAYPYSIKLSYFKTREEAQKSLFEFVKIGLSPYWVKVNLGEEGIWYRVFAGYFKDMDQAEKVIVAKQLAGATIKKTRYAAYIGSYTAEEEMQKKILALAGHGFSPYTIRDHSGTMHVYVGAFYTRKGAEEQYAELAAKKIDSLVIER